MNRLIEKVLSHPSVAAQPPVFVDVGASGGLSDEWRPFAAHSICIAFDADERDFEVNEVEGADWKNLYTLNRLLSDRASKASPFHLTSSPHCSSSLAPDNEALRPWAFARKFEVERTITLPSVTLPDVLRELGLPGIDWYKTDSQGTDLRIFRALGDAVIDMVLVAAFEPGIIHAYRGEDKLHALMAFMDDRPFWVAEMIVKGSQRLDAELYDSLSDFRRNHLSHFLRTAPGWAEITYFNDFSGSLPLRSRLLGWAFATARGQHGFAHALAREGARLALDPLFPELAAQSKAALGRPGSYGSLMAAAARRAGRAIGLK
jgi:hypothetical protein